MLFAPPNGGGFIPPLNVVLTFLEYAFPFFFSPLSFETHDKESLTPLGVVTPNGFAIIALQGFVS